MKRNLVKRLCVLTLCAGVIGAAGCGSKTDPASADNADMSSEYQQQDASEQQEASEEQDVSGEQGTSGGQGSQEENQQAETTQGSEKKTDEENIFAKLPSQFAFSSGAGAWATTFELNPDGTFTGQYQDSDMGDTGPGYENGTVYIAQFSGKFTEPQKVDDYSYTMKLDHLDVQGTAGESYIQDNVRYVYSDAYGFDDADVFWIYLPGYPLEDLPEEFLIWSSIDTQAYDAIPASMYGIYNEGGQEGFIGMDDSSL